MAAPNDSHSDGNHALSVIGVIGTLGTADTTGSAKTVPIGVDPATGAAYVYNLGPAGSVSLGNITGGTINLINAGTMTALGVDSGGTKHILSTDTGGTLNVNAAVSISGGTTNVGTVNTGTINTGTINLGTVVGKDANAAAQTANPLAVGGTDSGGTVRTISVDSGGALKITGGSGTNVNVVTGTVNVGTTVVTAGTVSAGTINTGTINTGTFVMTVGTVSVLPNLPQGSINVTAGTVGGKAASGAAAVANPVLIAGTDSGGTVYAPLVDTTGALKITGITSGTNVNLVTGTLNVGTINTGTVVGKDANAAAQTGNPVAIGGTDSGGTVRTVLVNSAGAMSVSGAAAGTFVNLSTGTLNVGTINTGTFVMTVGTVTVLPNLPQGSINVTAGTIGGKAASGAAAVANPVQIAGTDSGGTIYSPLVTTAGVMAAAMPSGTLNVGTINTGTMVMTVGTVSVLPNLPQGSINVTAGTVGGKAASGAAAVANPVQVAGTDSGGTIYSPLVTTAGVLSAAMPSGTLNVGTINAGTVAVTAGTVTAGTINVGTITTGTINTGTINLGTVVGKDANAAAQTANPLAMGGTDSGGTIRTVTVDSAGRLTVNSVAAGTTIGTISVGTVNTGTINTGTINTGTINVGTFVMPSGTINVGTVQVSGTVVGTVQQFTASVSSGADLITVQDVSAHKSGMIQIGGTWVGTINVQGDNDNSSFNNLPVYDIRSQFGTAQINITSNGLYAFPADTRFAKVRMTSYTSGTALGTLELYSIPFASKVISAVVPTGSIVVTAGTLAAGTINTGTITAGSITVIAGTVSAGTINTGTVNTGTINTGTINVATITAGTINVGTVRNDARTTQNIVTFGTQMALSAGTQGTVVGSASAGAGTYTWISDFSLMNPNGTCLCVLSFGTTQQGTNVLFRGVLGTQTAVGIEKSYARAVNAGMTNQDLVFSTGGAGTVDVSVSYFFSV